MKRPKMPKKVAFLGQNFERISEREGWESLVSGEDLTISVEGVARRYRLREGELVRVMIEDWSYKKFPNEEEIEEFSLWALGWAKAQRAEAERKRIQRGRSSYSVSENSPKKTKRTGGQFRLF